MKSFLPLQKFQEDDTKVWAINRQQRKEQHFFRKILKKIGPNRLSPVSVEWGGLRRDRAHRVKDLVHTRDCWKVNILFNWEFCRRYEKLMTHKMSLFSAQGSAVASWQCLSFKIVVSGVRGLIS
ncbi:hypothetical protein AVEN_274539-1 [Araneus ventricosus]|uniref:Uncharacterized protein n=1 Tax=Araneus ventricosus TaxID=182803 RepID=A0A4Y2NWE8_ARAVE|nr:hypothetical protein AVEN_274539-1 [Araneus ventricosus]